MPKGSLPHKALTYIVLLARILDIFNTNDNSATFSASTGYFSVQFKFESLFRENLLEILCNFLINACTTNGTEEFHCSNFSSKSCPYRAL